MYRDANAPANSNASAGTQTNTNASTNANVRSPGPGASPSPTSNETTTKLDADSIEPASGPISGKTLITIKGKNFGSKKEDIVVKFGESEAKVNQISDKSLSVSTPRHSEGLVDVTVAKGAESDVLTSAYTYTCPPPSGRGLFLMLQTNDEFTLTDDGQTHIVRVVLGEKAKPDANESEAGKLEPNQENGAAGDQTVSETQR